jgi:CHAT domain-containing protein
LQAGAQHVVGSLWPVRDEHAAEITTAFYEQYFAGNRPAPALAKTQRQAISAGAAWRRWAPFVCVRVA